MAPRVDLNTGRIISISLLALMFFFLCPFQGFAQNQGLSRSGLGISLLVVNPDEDTKGEDVGVAIDLQLPLSETLYLFAELDFYGWELQNEYDEVLVEADNSYFAGLVGLRLPLNLDLAVTPFIGAAIGYQVNDSDVDVRNLSIDHDIDNSLIYRGEAGLEFALGDFFVIWSSLMYQIGDASIEQRVETDSHTIIVEKDSDLNALIFRLGAQLKF